MRAAAALGLLMLAATAARATEVPVPDPVSITLSRAPCYGTCPVYTVEIRGDGTVTYVGQDFVAAKGRRTDQIPRAQVTALLARFHAAHFTALKDSYRASITDQPTYTLVLTEHGRRKTVVDYAGHAVGMPASVTALEQAVDQTAHTDRWVKGRG